MEKIEVYKTTEENWSPSYKLLYSHPTFLVRCFIIQLQDGQWRVAVWGADDFGMERDFLEENKSEAGAVFMTVISQKSITLEFLKSLGFYPA